MKKTIIIGIMLIMSSFSVLGAIGHPASQVFAGTFASGNFLFPGTLSVTSNLTVDSGTLFVDSANDRVGIGTSSPETHLKLDVSGAFKANDYWTEFGSKGMEYAVFFIPNGPGTCFLEFTDGLLIDTDCPQP